MLTSTHTHTQSYNERPALRHCVHARRVSVRQNITNELLWYLYVANELALSPSFCLSLSLRDVFVAFRRLCGSLCGLAKGCNPKVIFIMLNNFIIFRFVCYIVAGWSQTCGHIVNQFAPISWYCVCVCCERRGKRQAFTAGIIAFNRRHSGIDMLYSKFLIENCTFTIVLWRWADWFQERKTKLIEFY